MSIRRATETDNSTIHDIWWSSVKKTHHFLPAEYLLELKQKQQLFVNQLEKVFVYENDDHEPVGFLGLSKDKIELLFVHADHLRKGIGTILLNNAIGLGYSKLDCYEANVDAISFYRSKGFEIVGRDEVDFFSKPFPLLHLSLRRNE